MPEAFYPGQKDYIEKLNELNDAIGAGPVQSVNGRGGLVTLSKTDVALGNVDNTSDVNKPVSTAQQAALDLKIDLTQKGAANGVTPLDATGKVAAAYLPSFVDDVVEYATQAAFPGTGETGKIYVVTTGTDINKAYRWSGSAYIEISPSPGTTDAVPEGVTNKYFTVARVLAAALTGLTTGTNSPISAADTILVAAGKLQAQIDARTGTAGASSTRNFLINGDMLYDQRHEGVSFTIGAGSSAWSVDRFLVVNNTNQTVTVQQTSLANYNGSDIHKCLKLSFTVAPTTGSVLVKQRVKGVDKLAAQDITMSAYISSAETTMTASMYPIQVFGAGGSASVQGSSTALALAAAIGRFSGHQTLASIVGKTLGTSHWLEFVLDFAVRSTNPVFITDVQLEQGIVATAFSTRGERAEMDECRAYCYKTFPLGTAPAQNAGATGALTIGTDNSSTFSDSWMLPVRMMGNGATVTTYNPSAANANFRDTNNAADRTLNNATATDSVLHLVGLAGIVNGINRIHVLIDNELN